MECWCSSVGTHVVLPGLGRHHHCVLVDQVLLLQILLLRGVGGEIEDLGGDPFVWQKLQKELHEIGELDIEKKLFETQVDEVTGQCGRSLSWARFRQCCRGCKVHGSVVANS